MKILFFKSLVHAHDRTLHDGRVTHVDAHYDRRTQHASGDLFGHHEPVRPPTPAPVTPPAPTTAPEPEPAPPTFMSLLPPIPDVSGVGTHAQRAQNLVRRLSQAAILHDDPLTAIQAISTSRSTTFAARVDDYRQALIRHFQTAAATPAIETITAATRVPVLPPTPPVTQATQTATPLPANLPPVPDYSRSHGVHAVRAQNQVASIQRALASDNPLNAVQAIRTTRSTAFASRVDDYRTAVLAALAQQAGQHAGGEAAPAPTPAPAPQPEPTPAPTPTPTHAETIDSIIVRYRPDGIEDINHPLARTAWNRVTRLTMAARNSDPDAAQAAVLGVPEMPETNGYNRQVNAYRAALLNHLRAVNVARLNNPTPAPTPTPAPAPAVSVLANPMNLSEADLGFACRPNVPLSAYIDGTRLNEGYYANRDRTGGIIPWPAPEYVEAARRYLAQATSLQGRAREYQAGTWQPENPALRAQRQAAELEQRRIEAENMRAAAVARAARLGNMPDFFKPRNPVGANITSKYYDDSALAQASAFFGQPPADVENALLSIVADYGNATFNVSMNQYRDGLEISFRGSNGERIDRTFTKKTNGDFSVSHSYFSAGSRQGEGNGKHLFRTSLGAYHTLGVTIINVHANIDIGSYCWAKYAYLPRTQDAWDEARTTFKKNLAKVQNGTRQVVTNDGRLNYTATPYLPEEVTKIKAILNNPDPKSLWKLVDLRFDNRRESVGKELMMKTHWYGKIEMDNQEQMHRLVQYIAGNNGLQSYRAQTAASTATPTTPRRRTRRAPTQATA